MRFRVFFLCCTLCTVFYASTCYAEDKRLIAEQEDVIKQTEESRAAAAKSAKEWEAHIEKLNSEVIPDDHFSHDALKVRSHIAHKHAIHRMMAKSAAKHLKSQSAAKHLKPLAAEHKVKHMENQVWHHQTASEVNFLFLSRLQIFFHKYLTFELNSFLLMTKRLQLNPRHRSQSRVFPLSMTPQRPCMHAGRLRLMLHFRVRGCLHRKKKHKSQRR